MSSATQIFQPWQNALEQEPAKIPEVKKVIDKLEYKGYQKVKKEIEVRALLIKKKVTKGFLERQKIKPFGIGKTDDDIRQNVNLTSIQRENVWHPYYETKLEEEDLKEKFQRSKMEKKEKAMMNQDIEEIESKLKTLQDQEREEELKKQDAASGVKKFDIKKILEKRKQEEQFEQSRPQEDLQTVKLRNLSNEITEDDIKNAMSKFGDIIKVRIPMEELGGGRYSTRKNKGFAFVTFVKTSSADAAIKEKEITVEFATLDIERAMKRVMQPRDNPNRGALENLTRSKH